MFYIVVVIATLVGVVISRLIVLRRARGRLRVAEMDVLAGHAPVIDGAVRITTGNLWQRRWRHGFIRVTPARVGWRPRLRSWPRIELSGIRMLGGPRRPRGLEVWWISPDAWIYRAMADDHREYEVAALSASRRLFEYQIGRQAWPG